MNDQHLRILFIGIAMSHIAEFAYVYFEMYRSGGRYWKSYRASSFGTWFSGLSLLILSEILHNPPLVDLVFQLLIFAALIAFIFGYSSGNTYRNYVDAVGLEESSPEITLRSKHILIVVLGLIIVSLTYTHATGILSSFYSDAYLAYISFTNLMRHVTFVAALMFGIFAALGFFRNSLFDQAYRLFIISFQAYAIIIIVVSTLGNAIRQMGIVLVLILVYCIAMELVRRGNRSVDSISAYL